MVEFEVDHAFVSLFEDIVHSADVRLRCEIERGKVLLSAPDIALYTLKQSSGKFMYTGVSGVITTFMGVPLVPSYEMKIVLFHKDYPQYKEDWMKIEVNL